MRYAHFVPSYAARSIIESQRAETAEFEEGQMTEAEDAL